MNYSKWELLDVSSDDDDPADHHPNVDPRLIRRLKKEKKQREREEEVEQLKKEAESGGVEAGAAQKRLDQLDAMKNVTVREVSSRTVINKSESSTPKPSPPTTEEDEKKEALSSSEVSSSQPGAAQGGSASTTPSKDANEEPARKVDPFQDSDEAFVEFSRLYQPKCIQYAELTNFEESEKFLLYNYQVMLHKHAQGCLLLKMLELEMGGKTAAMKRYCRQYLMLANILDLAKGMKTDPRAALKPFFQRVKTKEAAANLVREVENFSKSIQLRAEQKKLEEAEDDASDGPASLEELGREERMGPGGLDPVEVFSELPESWQEAFTTRDMAKLQEAIRDVPLEEAKRLLKRCEDSGLWNPGSQDEGEDGPEEEDEEEDAEVEAQQEVEQGAEGSK